MMESLRILLGKLRTSVFKLRSGNIVAEKEHLGTAKYIFRFF